MASKDDIKADLDKKYKIKRPTFSADDLLLLQTNVVELQNQNPHWMDFWLDEPVLIRFLKAFITVKDTIEALRNYCEWRVKYSVDEISPDDVTVRKESMLGRDEYVEGVTDACERPVIVVYPRNHDSYHGDYESLNTYILFQLEQLCSVCDTIGDGTFCLVFDLKGFSMRNMDYQCVKKIVWFLKNCYPERLGVCLIINYPWVFYGCFEIIKLWLNDVTRSKILFCSEKELRDFIDLDSFPLQLLA